MPIKFHSVSPIFRLSVGIGLFKLMKYALPLIRFHRGVLMSIHRTLIFNLTPVLLLMLSANSLGYEGFGAVTTGADECQQKSVVRVTTLDDSGEGSLRSALSGDCRHVVFDVAGTIFLETRLYVQSFTTIDGATAPDVEGQYGITIKKFGGDKNRTLMELIQVHDVIIHNIRFLGEGFDDGNDSLSLIGCDRVIIDHISSGYADDGAIDISHGWGWGSNVSNWANRNITVSNSIIHNTAKAMLIKYGPHHNISLHHNLWARNVERSPQIRHQVETLEFVNNIVFEWGVPSNWGYGMRITSHDPEQRLNPSDEEARFTGDGLIDMNIIGNIFIEGESPSPGNGIKYLLVSEGDGSMGDLYYDDNILPAANPARASTIGQPLPVAELARITTQSTGDLPGALLGHVGPKFRTPEEQEIIAEVAATMGPRPMPPVLE